MANNETCEHNKCNKTPLRRSVFGLLPAQARLTYGWASVLITFLSFVVSGILAAVLGGIVYGVSKALAQGADGLPVSDPAAILLEPSFLIPVFVGQFVFWLLFIALWVGVFERRGLSSLGWSDGVMWRYARGVGMAVLAVLALALVAGIANALGWSLTGSEMEAGLDVVQSQDLSSLIRPGILVGIVLVALLFMFQGAVEEIVFRGWLLSTLDVRWGRMPAVLVSAFLFASFHIQHIQNDLTLGLLSVAAIGMMGLFFTLYALKEQSIVGVCGLHGAFNALVIIGGVMGSLFTDPSQTFLQAFMGAMDQSAGLGVESEQIPLTGVIVQGVTFLVLCLIPLSGLVSRKVRI